jgi:hypothetical protein
MLDLYVQKTGSIQRLIAQRGVDLAATADSPEELVKLLIIRDLFRLGWTLTFKGARVLITPPESYDKQIIRDSMQIKRQELLARHSTWVTKQQNFARANLAYGQQAWNSPIQPVIEVCESQQQLDLFRILRFYWSSPYSEYVGRRIKLLIRDDALPNKPIIGLAALGSSIIHIPDRDKWIGWDKVTRTNNLIYTMDAYVLGALPPYNHLLGGKLISYIIASNEVRAIYQKKYAKAVTNILGRSANRLACIFTTSLYGKSSQYNRVKYNDHLLYIPIGETKGFGTLHLTDETFAAMRGLLQQRNIVVANRFGDGPIWRMRLIRTVADVLGFESDFLLKHSFRREIYAVPLAHNFREFLKGEHTRLRSIDYPLSNLVEHWRNRWLQVRKSTTNIKDLVYEFKPETFVIH